MANAIWRLTAAGLLCALVACGQPGLGAGPAGEPQHYAVFDALFVQRNTGTVDRPLVVRSSTGAPLMSGWNPTSSVGLGGRLFYGELGDDELGWEVGYLGVFGMSSDTAVTDANGLLQAAGDLGLAPGAGLNNATSATYSGLASLNSIEANAVFHQFDGGFDKRSPYPWQRRNDYDGGGVDWLAGFRWAGLDDSATLAFRQVDAPVSNTYTVNAATNLFAAQTGLRGRLGWQDWALEGFMKVGIAGTLQSQSQTMANALTDPPFAYRSPRSGDRIGMGMIAELNLSAVYRIDDVWGLRIGYDLMWLTGVALAPDQFDFSANSGAGAGTGVLGTGNLCLNGANLGLEARW